MILCMLEHTLELCSRERTAMVSNKRTAGFQELRISYGWDIYTRYRTMDFRDPLKLEIHCQPAFCTE